MKEKSTHAVLSAPTLHVGEVQPHLDEAIRKAFQAGFENRPDFRMYGTAYGFLYREEAILLHIGLKSEVVAFPTITALLRRFSPGISSNALVLRRGVWNARSIGPLTVLGLLLPRAPPPTCAAQRQEGSGDVDTDESVRPAWDSDGHTFIPVDSATLVDLLGELRLWRILDAVSMEVYTAVGGSV